MATLTDKLKTLTHMSSKLDRYRSQQKSLSEIERGDSFKTSKCHLNGMLTLLHVCDRLSSVLTTRYGADSHDFLTHDDYEWLKELNRQLLEKVNAKVEKYEREIDDTLRGFKYG